MSTQLLEDELLLSDFLRLTSSKPTEEDIEEMVRVLKFSACLKLSRKFDRLRRRDTLTDGMVITVKDKKNDILYAGKVYMEPEKLGIGTFEIYVIC